MCKFIGIENVIANALIEKMALNGYELSFDKIREFGYKVCDSVYNLTNDRMIIIHEKDDISNFILNYSEYFTLKTKEDGKEYIVVRDTVNSTVLKNLFRWDLPFYLIDAYLENGYVLK